MGLHLYCVTPAGVAPADERGIADVPVRAIVAGALAVWVTEHEAAPRATAEAAQQHHGVVVAAMRRVTPVPLRFGQWVGDEAGVRERTLDRQADWLALLGDLEGTAEYGLHVMDPRLTGPAREVRPAAAASGRAYLEALAGSRSEQQRRTEEGRRIAGEIAARIGPSVLRTRVDPLETAHGLASVALLVRSSAAAEYEAGLGRALAAHPELRFLPSGPWPPYSFTT